MKAAGPNRKEKVIPTRLASSQLMGVQKIPGYGDHENGLLRVFLKYRKTFAAEDHKSSLPKKMRDVPAGVSCESQEEHHPPEKQNRAHPELVIGDAELLGQNARARGQENV